MFKSVFIDRRIWLLVLILVLVSVLTRVLLSAQDGFRWVVDGGYWVTLAMVMLFARAVCPLISDRWRQASCGRFEVGVVAGILAVTCIWVSHERPGYKILADELLLSGTAMGLHYERKAALPTRATDVQGAFMILDRSLDKRPLLFPLVVATLHDVMGYRPQNAFYVNMVLSVVFLWLVYLIGWNVGRSRWAGVMMGLLFAGLPLMAQQSTGGGFELLNLLLIAGFILLMAYYLERPDERSLEALIYGTLLLACTRYESVVFLLPSALAAVLGWWRKGAVLLTWPLILSPVFLSPWLLQNRLFSAHEQAWQMQGQAGVTEPFGFQYLAANLGHALAFFFDISGYSANSLVFALLGLVCVPFLALWVVRVLRRAAVVDGMQLAWAVAGLSLFGVTAVYLLYFWGKFDDPIISRLSLPVHMLMALGIVVIGSLVFKGAERGWKITCLVALGGLLFQGLPVMARQAYRTDYSPGVEMQLRTDFLNQLTERNVLVLDRESFFWILQKIPSSMIKNVRNRKDALIYHLRNRSFQEMYVVQSLSVDPDTGTRRVAPVDELGADYELETVWEKRVQTLLFVRISRITAIRDGDQTTIKPGFVKPLEEKRTPEEIERARVLYMENWIKQLP